MKTVKKLFVAVLVIAAMALSWNAITFGVGTLFWLWWRWMGAEESAGLVVFSTLIGAGVSIAVLACAIEAADEVQEGP